MEEKFIKIYDDIDKNQYRITFLNGNIINLLSKKISNPRLYIHVDTTENLAFYDPNLDRININIHFMSYIWMFCYVAFHQIEKQNEDLMTQEQREKYGKLLDLNNPEIQANLKNISDEVFNIFTKNKSINEITESLIPNEISQQKYTNDFEEFISKVNGIYVRAVAFILFHEYGHMNLKHIYTSVQQSLINEKEADDFAINSILDLEPVLDDKFLTNASYGMLSGFLSLFFISDYNGLMIDNDHPSLVYRINRIIDEIIKRKSDFSEINYFKHYCCSVFASALINNCVEIKKINAGDDIDSYFKYLYEEANSYKKIFILRDLLKSSFIYLVDSDKKLVSGIFHFVNVFEKKVYLQTESSDLKNEATINLFCLYPGIVINISFKPKEDLRECAKKSMIDNNAGKCLIKLKDLKIIYLTNVIVTITNKDCKNMTFEIE